VRGAARSNQRPNSRAITKQSTTRKNHVYASLALAAEKRESARRPSRNKIAIKIKRKNACSSGAYLREVLLGTFGSRGVRYLLRAIIYGRALAALDLFAAAAAAAAA
jgi:hypothetical protein